jgi:hypothetical protein
MAHGRFDRYPRTPEPHPTGGMFAGGGTLRPIPWLVVLLGCLVLVAQWPLPARAESPLVAELARVFPHYDQDPARLDALRTGLTAAVQTDPDVPNLIALAQACYLWGANRAPTSDERLQAYEPGRRAGERAVQRAPQNAVAHLWFAINTGRWAQTKGVLRSLVLLPTLKAEIATILQLDPTLPGAYALAGNVYAEVPAVFGGSLSTAEYLFREDLKLDPRFTALRVGLAKNLIKEGRTADAKQELAWVLEEQNPDNPADWALQDTTEARAVLDQLQHAS